MSWRRESWGGASLGHANAAAPEGERPTRRDSLELGGEHAIHDPGCDAARSMLCGISLRVVASTEAELAWCRTEEKYERGQRRKYVGGKLRAESGPVEGPREGRDRIPAVMSGGYVVDREEELVGRNRQEQMTVRRKQAMNLLKDRALVLDMLQNIEHARSGETCGWQLRVFEPSANHRVDGGSVGGRS